MSGPPRTCDRVFFRRALGDARCSAFFSRRAKTTSDSKTLRCALGDVSFLWVPVLSSLPEEILQASEFLIAGTGAVLAAILPDR